MITVCQTMGLARSHARGLLGRNEGWTDGRSHRTPCDDAGLLVELRQEIADLPSYGYRHACALVTCLTRRRYWRNCQRPSSTSTRCIRILR